MVQTDISMLERYDRAAALLQGILGSSRLNADVHPRWLGCHDRFWYERRTRAGKEYRLVDATKGVDGPLFDPRILAKALSATSRNDVDPDNLPLNHLRVDGDPLSMTFSALGCDWEYCPDSAALRMLSKKRWSPDWLVSPDGRSAAFVRDFNLWIRDIETGNERALTRDGEQYHAYSALPDRVSGLKFSFGDRITFRPEAIWSPDSRMLFTLRTDERSVIPLPLLEFSPQNGDVRPRLIELRTPWPGDEHVTKFSMMVVDATTGRVHPARYPSVVDVRMTPALFAAGLAWWGSDAKLAYFVDVERGEKRARVVELEVLSGVTRVLFEECSETYIDFNIGKDHAPASIVPVPRTNELIWFSERSGWGHLYLYDLRSGRLKNAITKGEWVVRDVLHFDAQRRELFFTAAGRHPGRDPYLREVCRVGVDGGDVAALASSDHDHSVFSVGGDRTFKAFGGDPSVIGMSPSGNYFVDTYARADELPVSVVRNRDGDVVLELERISEDALPKHWRYPEPIQTMAADKETSVYGLVFRPSGFDSKRRYPVLNFVYGGPQLAWVPKGISECMARRVYLQAAAFAELGFITVMLDGRGTAGRSKRFHDASYGRFHTNSNLQDHIAAIRQLGARYDFMDLDRVGVVGMSGGGYLAARAMLEYPDFYKVGVSAGGNHDQLAFWHPFGERYQGLPGSGVDYKEQANKTLALKLKGKLLFVHGLMDSGCHPAALFQLIESLIRSNRDYDLVLLPNGGHAWTDYGLRRCWDYLVEHLGGEKPPAQYALVTGGEGIL